MLFFLRFINPLLAVLVLSLCILSACTRTQHRFEESGRDHLTLKYQGFFKDPIQIYFLGKGIFAALSIFLLGKIVEYTLVSRTAWPPRLPGDFEDEAPLRPLAPLPPRAYWDR